MTDFNEDYFENGIVTGVSGYTNYRWIPELTIPMCSDLVQQLNIPYGATVLDYGCAKGYSVKALRLLHRESYGVDISEYAVKNCPSGVEDYIKLLKGDDEIPVLHGGEKYDWCFSKDVFEHIPYEKLLSCLTKIRKVCYNMFVAVPLGDGEKYFCESFELDKTHVIREDLDWWKERFSEAGFKVKTATYRMKYIKENYAQHKKGNGFFICE
jgi:SAM-dependent methyltransferase